MPLIMAWTYRKGNLFKKSKMGRVHFMKSGLAGIRVIAKKYDENIEPTFKANSNNKSPGSCEVHSLI